MSGGGYESSGRTPDELRPPMSADRTPAPVAVSVEIDSDDLRRHAELLADEGEHGPAHVLFTAAKHIEAGGDIPEWMGKPIDPRPEPVVAPLPTEAVTLLPAAERFPNPKTDVDRLAITLMTTWERVEGPVGTSYVANFADMARDALAAGYRLVPEDGEDTVRRVRALAESWAEADGETVDDHGLTTLTVTNRLGRTLLAALDGPR